MWDCMRLLGVLCFRGRGLARRRGRCLKLVRASQSICYSTANIIYIKNIYVQFHKLLYFHQELTMLVGCGIVGNSRRSSDLLMTPVSLFWKDKRIHFFFIIRTDEEKIESECQ